MRHLPPTWPPPADRPPPGSGGAWPPPPSAVGPWTAEPEWAREVPRPQRRRRLAASLASFVLVAGVALGAVSAFRLLRAPGDALGKMVPESAAIYATAALQPSGAQALALSGLFPKFPVLASSSARSQWVDTLVDDILKGTGSGGLGHSDVLPWLGAQIGLSADANGLVGSSSGSDYAVYVSTTDDAATQAALQKWRSAQSSSHTGGVSYSFTTEQHGGITVTAVSETFTGFENLSPGLGSGQDLTVPATPAPSTPYLSYAVVDHVLVLAGSTGYLDEVIDTDQGHHPSLEANADYQQLLGQLSSDRLALLFLDFPAVLQAVEGATGGSGGASIQPALDLLKAYRGLGVSAEARSDGLAIDAVTDYDPSQLTADERAAAAIAPDDNAAAAITPASAAAFYGFAGVQALVKEVLDSLDVLSPGAGSFLDQLGLRPVLLDLTGDLGLELDPGAAAAPAGALIVGTSNPTATRQFLDQMIPSVVGQTVLPGAVAPSPSLNHVTYRGVDITVYELPEASQQLAWTVTGGQAVIASSLDEMKAIIDTIHGAPSLSRSADYAKTAGGTPSTGVAYVNMSQVTALVDSSLSGSARTTFEQNVLPNLRPIRSISLTETGGPSATVAQVLIEVP